MLTYHQVRILKSLHRTITFVYHNSNMEMSDSKSKRKSEGKNLQTNKKHHNLSKYIYYQLWNRKC